MKNQVKENGHAQPCAAVTEMETKKFYHYRYKTHARLIIKEILESLLDFEELSGKLGLDAGCGWGWFMHYAVTKNIDMHGFEVNLKTLRKAIVFGVATDRLIVSDIQHIPFRDQTFDFAICWHVIEHVQNPKKALNEIRRVLKTGSVLILGAPHEQTVTNLVFKPFRLLCQRGTDSCFAKRLAFYDPTHLREYTCSSLLAMLENEFQVMKVRLDTFDLPVFRIFSLIGILPPEAKILRRIAVQLPKSFRRAITICAKTT